MAEITQPNIGKSIAAVLAGIIVGVGLTLATDAVMHKTGVFPELGKQMSEGLFVLATAYRIVYGILGSYIMARLAPGRPMRHALIGGWIGVVVSTAGAITTWNRDLGPHWYSIALIITALPCAWAGGMLRLRQLRQA